MLREPLSALEARTDPRRFASLQAPVMMFRKLLTACGGGDPIVTTDNGSIRDIITDDMRWPGAIEGLAMRGLSNVELAQREELCSGWRKSFTTNDRGR